MNSLLNVIPGVPGWIWGALSVASLLMSAVGVLAVPWMVRRMPVDWFSREPANFRTRLSTAPVATMLRNGLGGALLMLGIALLFLPGQGVLTIVLGVVLTDLPLRDRGLRWVGQRPKLAATLQKWRRTGRVPEFTGLATPQGPTSEGAACQDPSPS